MPPSAIYLDHNATAPILPAVADAVRDASLRYGGNPASQHDAGRQARRALEAARCRVGEILGAKTTGIDADQVIFTSGGTESNNLALVGLLAASTPLQPRPGLVEARRGDGAAPRLLISAMEHASVMRTARQLAANGCEASPIELDQHGVVRLAHLEQLLADNPPGPLPAGTGADASLGTKRPSSDLSPPERTTLVSVMLASNETGVLQPVASVASLCREHRAVVHTDAAQVVGKLPVDFRRLGVDALTAAAHKFHGPLGIGVLILRHGVKLQPMFLGGFQQAGLRSGTECIALAIGMQTALELWLHEADERQQRMAALRDRFECEILAGYPSAVIIGAAAPRLPHTSNIAFVGLDRQPLAMALDLAGIACSTGSACASGSSEPSPALLAMGLPEAVVAASIRFSLGATTTAADVAEATGRILSVANRLRHGK